MYQYHHITITGMDAKKTKPGSRSGLFLVFLNLSFKPSSSWSQDFDKTWKTHIYMEKRSAQVVGDQILITCALEDWDTVHLPELRKIVKEVDSRQQAEARDADARRKEMEQAKAEMRRKIEEAASRFKKEG